MAEESKKHVPVARGKDVERAPARVLSPFEDIERVFDEFFSRPWPSLFRWERPLLAGLRGFEERMPRLDVIDRDDEVVVRAEVPGVRREDIEITLTGNLITVKGETKKEEKEEKGDYYRCEISRGSFSRTVSLPAEVDDSKAKATVSDGVLEIVLPKVEKSKKRTIKVS